MTCPKPHARVSVLDSPDWNPAAPPSSQASIQASCGAMAGAGEEEQAGVTGQILDLLSRKLLSLSVLANTPSSCH